jgi:hypothetical protein
MLRTKAGRTIAAGIAGLRPAAARRAALGHPSATTPEARVGNSKAGKVARFSARAPHATR